MYEPTCVGCERRFSVVIPLFNKDRHIVSTLESVLAQSFSNFEVVVVDDGSTDSSLANVLSVNDKRIRVVQQKNQGVSAARNVGVKESVGEYIAFLDADDLWYPWHLEELNRLIVHFEGYAISSVAHEISRDGQVFLPERFSSPDFSGVVPDVFAAFRKSLALVNSTTACLSRAFLESLGGFPEGVKKGEDVYVWLRAAIEKGLVYSARVCARYNQDAQSRSNLCLSDEIPYYLIWLDRALMSRSLAEEHVSEARKFLQLGVFFNAAGYRLDGNAAAFCAIKSLSISVEARMRVLLTVLRFCPRYVLGLAKRYRHPRVRSSG